MNSRNIRERKYYAKEYIESNSIEQSLAEAEALITQIRSDAMKDMQEEHRVQFEKHAQNLEQIKSKVREQIKQKESSEICSGADEMHEAIQDIVKGMSDLKNKFFR